MNFVNFFIIKRDTALYYICNEIIYKLIMKVIAKFPAASIPIPDIFK